VPSRGSCEPIPLRFSYHRDGLADGVEPTQDVGQLRLVEVDPERESIADAWLVKRDACGVEVTLPVAHDVDAEPALHRFERGAPIEFPVERTKLVPEADELFGSKLSVESASEAASGDLDRGGDPVTVPVIRCLRTLPPARADDDVLSGREPNTESRLVVHAASVVEEQRSGVLTRRVDQRC
jgi:hypothetical protein